MVKLARNEQCITLYPLMARYSVVPFPTHVIFRASWSPFILGLISSIRLLTARYWPFLIVGPNSARGYNRPINLLGRFHSVIKYGRLTTAHYGWPMNGRFQL